MVVALDEDRYNCLLLASRHATCFMASDAGATATQSPLTITAAAHDATHPTIASDFRPVASPEPAAADPTPVPTLKRHRDDSPVSPTSPRAADFPREYSPIKVARLGLTARVSPPPLQLTGAAAIDQERRRREEEERRTPPGISENSKHRALSELMSGGTLAVSRPQDAPANMDEVALAAEAAAKALGPVTIPQPNVSDARTDISPQSTTSAAGATVDNHGVANSPAPMDIDPRDDHQSYTSQPEAQMAEKAATSLSYPGILAPGGAMPAPTAPPRPSSVPQNGENTPSSSSSNKKHKCPYCETEFTRHHNLKSHLLTHSQEKPYCCQTCNLRFRRLHDLKRHGKLHTGEKPHVCPKCDRKFARGDALARHAKGAGGCAGRRASVGDYGDQGDYDGAPRNDGDESMTGISYDGNGDVDLSEEERRRLSLPAIKAHYAVGSAEPIEPHSRTYPPVVRPRSGAPNVLYPPNTERTNNAAVPGANLVHSIAGKLLVHPENLTIIMLRNLMDAQTGITESPKPLSPAVHDQARQRSPSFTSQAPQQQQYPRRPSERELHPLPTLPPPHGSSYPPVSYDAQHPQVANLVQGQHPPLSSSGVAHPRTSSGSNSHANSGDSSANLFAQGDTAVWSYIQQLEERVKDLNARLSSVEHISNAREARIASVESTLSQREAKIGFMELEIMGLRKDLAAGQPQERATQTA